MIKIFIIDRYPLYITGFTFILDSYSKKELKVVGSVNSIEDIYTKISQILPDVVLLDLEIKKIEESNVCRTIKEKWPEIKIVGLSEILNYSLFLHCLENGIDSILLKKMEQQILPQAICAIMRGEKICGENVPSHEYLSTMNKKLQTLSGLELKLLNLLAKGKMRKQAGILLDIKPCAIDKICHSIFSKFNKNRLLGVVSEAKLFHIIE